MMITTDGQANEALYRLEGLMDLNPPLYSPDSDLLEILAEAITHFEDRSLGYWYDEGGQ